MADQNRKPTDHLSDDELRLILEKELEQSVTAEINRIREEKADAAPSEASLPPLPDFRPDLSDFSAGKNKRSEKKEKKKRAVGSFFSYFFVFLLLAAAVAAAFWLLFSLYGKQASSLTSPGKDSSLPDAESGVTSVADSGNTSAGASGDTTSDGQDGSDLIIPSGGFSAKDAKLTAETVTEEARAADGTLVFTTVLDLPKLEYSANPVAERRISAALAELSAEYRTDAKQKAADYAEGYTAGASPGSYEVRWSSMSAKDGILTLTATVSSKISGASPLTTVECSNFSAVTGELLSLSDVVTDPSQLAALAVTHVDKSLVWEEIYESVILNTVCDSWYPSAEGIVLIYQKYSIGPGASGTIEVLIPYGESEGILSDRITAG